MKRMKRMLAVLLTIIMTLAMATTAFAAEPLKGNLTVNVNAKNTLEGQTIKVYKLFDLSVSVNNYAYTVNADYKSAIATALGLQGTATSEDLYNKLVVYESNSNDIQTFADNFTTAALTGGTDATATSGKLGKVSNHKFEDLDYGYYLVYQTGTKEIQSSLVSVDKAEETVNLKGEAPSITKTAITPNTAPGTEETVAIGQVVTYTITGTIPDTTGYDAYVYKIVDTLTNGLDFVKNAQGTAQESADYTVSVQIKNGASSTQTATLGGENKRTMTLDLSQWIRNSQENKGAEFTVTYYAKVNANAVVTEKNKATLEYGNDSVNTTTTIPSEVKTPTYPLQIHKFARGNEVNYLADATFCLYKTEKDAIAKTNPITVSGSNGIYKADPTSQNSEMVSVATAIAEGMNLKLNGLAAGEYWLVETKAPDGYHGVTAPLKITIAKSTTESVNDWTIGRGDGVAVTDRIIDIENSTGTILPGTGGMGTVLFTIVGVALILIVAASFIISRRKRNR